MKISNDIIYIGVNDTKLDLFESQYTVPQGMSYNSYVILDEKIAVMDTVDADFTHEWLDNLENALGSRKPDYLIVQHMEPDHSANIENFLKLYPKARVVCNAKTVKMIEQFFGENYADRHLIVKDGESLSLGSHSLTFIYAPMVHWPEVMMTYESKEKVLFTADGFGRFGTWDADVSWEDEARRYYIGIVGKYGTQVQNVLRKIKKMEIDFIAPLHGPVLEDNLEYYIGLYDTWSSYTVEEEGIVIAYTSVYGNTKKAAELIRDKLISMGAPEVVMHNLASCDMSVAIADAFRYSKLVLATTTYNAGIFPFMNEFIHGLTERGFKNRTVAFVENGTWAPIAAKTMKSMLDECKNLTYCENTVTLESTLHNKSRAQVDALCKELCREYGVSAENANKNNPAALFNIGYGLYVVTSNDGKKDNGIVVNTVTQLTNSPDRIAVTINKQSYSYHIVSRTGKMNVNCLNADASFDIFKRFGFVSGRNTDKFKDTAFTRSDNGLAVLEGVINSFISLEVESYVDVDTHGMFICRITEARVINDKETMTYTYYQKKVKPKPKTKGKKGFVCKICGYIYEGDTLPEDFICPLCKHPASDFEPIE